MIVGVFSQNISLHYNEAQLLDSKMGKQELKMKEAWIREK